MRANEEEEERVCEEKGGGRKRKGVLDRGNKVMEAHLT